MQRAGGQRLAICVCIVVVFIVLTAYTGCSAQQSTDDYNYFEDVARETECTSQGCESEANVISYEQEDEVELLQNEPSSPPPPVDNNNINNNSTSSETTTITKEDNTPSFLKVVLQRINEPNPTTQLIGRIILAIIVVLIVLVLLFTAGWCILERLKSKVWILRMIM